MQARSESSIVLLSLTPASESDEPSRTNQTSTEHAEVGPNGHFAGSADRAAHVRTLMSRVNPSSGAEIAHGASAGSVTSDRDRNLWHPARHGEWSPHDEEGP